MGRASKVVGLDEALRRVTPGTRLLMGEFVGAGEPAKCIEWLLKRRVDRLTLIANSPGMRGGFLKAKLFEQGQITEFRKSGIASLLPKGGGAQHPVVAELGDRLLNGPVSGRRQMDLKMS